MKRQITYDRTTPVCASAVAGEVVRVGDDIKGIRGYAWVWGPPDRMNRIIPKAAATDRAVKLPLFAYHDDEQGLGSAVVGPPDDLGLPYEATFATFKPGTPHAMLLDDIKSLIDAEGIAAVSMSWLALEPVEYNGDPWDFDATITFPKVEWLEMSVCPVPANSLVTLHAASLMSKMHAGEIADLLTLPSRSEIVVPAAHTAASAAALRERWQAANGDAPAGSLVAVAGQLDDALDNLITSLDRDDDALTRSLATVADTLCDKLLAVVGVVDDDEGGGSASLDLHVAVLDAEVAAAAV